MTLQDYLNNLFWENGTYNPNPTINGRQYTEADALKYIIQAITMNNGNEFEDVEIDTNESKCDQYVYAYKEVRYAMMTITDVTEKMFDENMGVAEENDIRRNYYKATSANFINDSRAGFNRLNNMYMKESPLGATPAPLTKERMAESLAYYKSVKEDYDRKAQSRWFRFKTHLFGKSAAYKTALNNMKELLIEKGISEEHINAYVNGSKSMNTLLAEAENVPTNLEAERIAEEREYQYRQEQARLKEAQYEQKRKAEEAIEARKAEEKRALEEQKKQQELIQKQQEKENACKEAVDKRKLDMLPEYRKEITDALKNALNRDLTEAELNKIANAKVRGDLIQMLVPVNRDKAKEINTAWREDDKKFGENFMENLDAKNNVVLEEANVIDNNIINNEPHQIDLSNKVEEKGEINNDMDEYEVEQLNINKELGNQK